MKDRAVLAIEEPEIYLHPQAQRQLYKSFRALAYPVDGSSGTQIFYTTHNPSFVDAQCAYEIEMLSKDKNRGTFNLKKIVPILIKKLRKKKNSIYTHNLASSVTSCSLLTKFCWWRVIRTRFCGQP